MNRRRPGDRAQCPDDAGFSLVEVMVTMAIMGIMMVIFTGGILQIYRTTTATESINIAQSQLQLAFQRLDKEVRYASWIAEPGKVGTTWYVEFAGPTSTECRQLRLATTPAGGSDQGVLQLVKWTQGTPPSPSAPRQTIASEVVTTGVDPFDKQSVNETPYAGPSPSASTAVFTTDFQRLRIRLTTKVATGEAQIDTTFTALNTSQDTPATNACSEGRPTS